MNFLEPLKAAVKASAADYRAGRITVEQMRERAERIGRLRRRAGDLERRKDGLRRNIARAHRMLGRVRAAIQAGGPIVAIDVGFDSKDGPARDVGITTWRDGMFVTVCYHVEGQPVPGIWSETVILPFDQIVQHAQTVFDGAALAVFHMPYYDLERLPLVTTATYYADTSFIGNETFVHTPSLDELCQRYGIANEGWHNSGNDSRRTMEVLLALAEHGVACRYRL